MLTRAGLLLLIALAGCKRSATGAQACDEHLQHRRACATQLGGDLGALVDREADRLEQRWIDAAKRNVKGWKEKYGNKWCTAANDEARTAFPECRW